MAAKGEVSLWAIGVKPGGMAAMRSPWLIQTVERWPGARRPSNRGEGRSRRISARPILAVVGGLDPAAELGAHGLLAVADAQHRHAELEHGGGCARAQRLVGRGGAAGEDDAAGREAADESVVHGAGMDLAVDAVLAHAARDQLGVLRAEIEDQDALGHGPSR